jgi:16S rRNA (guanine527-N7)-methyltransferase
MNATFGTAGDLAGFESARPQLVHFVEMLTKWNRVYNLTAVRDPPAMWTHHVLDSLTLAPHLPKGVRLLDVGSGAGLPGLVLALVRPDLSIVSIDAVNKKTSFQRQVAAELAITNHVAHHTRVEDYRDEPFPFITARAFASLADFLHLTRPLLNAETGTWLAMKGEIPAAEMADLPTDVTVETHALRVPGLTAQRHLIKLRLR